MSANFKSILFGSVAIGFTVAIAACSQQTSAPAAEAVSVPVTSYVSNFRLVDQVGKGHELHYWTDVPAVVLISQCNDCSAAMPASLSADLGRRETDWEAVELHEEDGLAVSLTVG